MLLNTLFFRGSGRHEQSDIQQNDEIINKSDGAGFAM